MTSREVLDLLNAKSGRIGTESEITYRDLRQAMAAMGLQFEAREYRGEWLHSYLGRVAIHRLAAKFDVELYPSANRS